MSKILTTLRYFLPLIVALNLFGCISLQLPNAQTHFQKKSAPTRKKMLLNIQQWHMMGAVSIQNDKNHIIIAYEWRQQNAANYSINLHSSLNLYQMQILGQSNGVKLIKDRKTSFAKTPEALMKRELGWYLPLSYLFYWIRGLPGPGNAQQQFDQFGHLIQLQQAGWKIQFSRYHSFQKIDLPSLINLAHSQFKVRIVIKQFDTASKADNISSAASYVGV